VYGNNPATGGKRQSKPNVVWDLVKHLKEKTTDGVVVDAKYTKFVFHPSPPQKRVRRETMSTVMVILCGRLVLLNVVFNNAIFNDTPIHSTKSE